LFNQKYLYFCIFSLALQQVRTAHAGRTHALSATLSGVPLSAVRYLQANKKKKEKTKTEQCDTKN
jgi:hypothetical protein